jgi:hypothetical protein
MSSLAEWQCGHVISEGIERTAHRPQHPYPVTVRTTRLTICKQRIMMPKASFDIAGAGPPDFLFVHGLRGDRTHFEPQMEYFVRQGRVLTCVGTVRARSRNSRIRSKASPTISSGSAPARPPSELSCRSGAARFGGAFSRLIFLLDRRTRSFG